MNHVAIQFELINACIPISISGKNLYLFLGLLGSTLLNFSNLIGDEVQVMYDFGSDDTPLPSISGPLTMQINGFNGFLMAKV